MKRLGGWAKAITLLLGGVLIAQVVWHSPAASAATAPTLQVTPALENLQQKSGQNSLSYVATVINNTDHPLTIAVSAQDFTTFNTTGTLVFVKPKQAGSHQLATSLSFSQSQLTVPAFTSVPVTVTISNAMTLADGGHYAGILFKAAPDNPSQRTVQFQQTVASLLFMTTAGQGVYHLQAQALRQSIAWIKFPRTLNLLFSNSGNVQVSPHGYLTLNGPFHRQTKLIINTNSALVLPGTKRLLQTVLSPSGRRPFWPGIYTMHVYYRADGNQAFTPLTVRFLYVNLLNVSAVALIAGLATYVVRTIKIAHKNKPSRPTHEA